MVASEGEAAHDAGLETQSETSVATMDAVEAGAPATDESEASESDDTETTVAPAAGTEPNEPEPATSEPTGPGDQEDEEPTGPNLADVDDLFARLRAGAEGEGESTEAGAETAPKQQASEPHEPAATVDLDITDADTETTDATEARAEPESEADTAGEAAPEWLSTTRGGAGATMRRAGAPGEARNR